MSDETTPKGSGGRNNRRPRRSYQGPKKSPEKFQAPTPGLEDVIFDTSTSAADFNKNIIALGEHMAVAFKRGGSAMSRS